MILSCILQCVQKFAHGQGDGQQAQFAGGGVACKWAEEGLGSGEKWASSDSAIGTRSPGYTTA